jgi:hypothetical protein
MRELGVFTALALSGMTACAERIVSPDAIPEPALSSKAAPKPWPNDVEARRQAEIIAEDARRRSAVRPRLASPSASFKPERRPKTQAPPLPQVSQQPKEPSISPHLPVVAALPPPPEPAEPNFPVAALMPPPPEPAEPTFPSTPPAIALPSPPEPPTSTLPDASLEAMMPLPPEPAEPSFPVAALPPSPEPAEPSLPARHAQGETAAESSISIPFPELTSYLSLRPRFDWVDTVGAIEVLRGPQSEALEASPVKGIPSLIRNPWPLPTDAS